jgi:membrane fusion protein (multidrug efflux system)
MPVNRIQRVTDPTERSGAASAFLGNPVVQRLAAPGFLLLAGFLLASCDEPAQAAPEMPPPKVTVVRLQPQPVSIQTILPGRTAAYRVAEVRPQVGGVLQEKLFREGETVTAGQPLFQIDPATYRAALASAEAGLARAEATLASARLTASRHRSLVTQNAVSRQDFDNSVAAQKQAEADVASARAAVDLARINLDRTRLVSPIDGRTGRSMLTEGALVTADQPNALLTVTQLDPIFVDVTQPSATLLRLRRDFEEGRLQRSTETEAQVRLILEDGTEYSHPGRLQFSEVTVDSGTGSVTMRAVFPNPDGILMPGMFVRERLEAGVSQNALLVPQQAVTRNPRGEATTLVVKEDGSVQQRTIVASRTIGTKWLVTGGVEAGDRIIVEGVQRVRDGVRPAVTETTVEDLDRRGSGQPAAPAVQQARN